MKTESDWDEFYLNVANLTAQQSYADDRKVGSIIVKDGNIISFSYNGTPKGWDNETQDNTGETKDSVFHAESQAIAKVARSTQSTEGATLYSTLSPCLNCAKLISQSGITRVVYRDTYKCTKGISFLTLMNVAINRPYSTTMLANPEWLAKSGLL